MGGSPSFDPGAWLDAVCAGSDTGALVRSHDWAATPLGPVDRWSVSLRAAVGTCLTSRFPMLVTWGPELVMIYNDGYRDILGADKHPAALGAPARDVWPEIWDEIEPLFAQVTTTGQAHYDPDIELAIERNGFVEDTHFEFCYSPLFDDDGSIGGVLDVVTETTAQVTGPRRLAGVAELAAQLQGLHDVSDVAARAMATLGKWPEDVDAAGILLEMDGTPQLVASTRPATAGDPARAYWPEGPDGGPVVLGDTAGGTRPAERVTIPLGRGTEVRGALVVAPSPRSPFDDSYLRFLTLTASTIDGALQSAVQHATEVGEYRRISDTLQAAMLKPASDLPTVAARYLPAVGSLAVGGDWYDVIDLDGERRGLVVGDCVGHGLQAAAAMAQLRSASRAALLQGGTPSAALAGLDRFATTTPEAYCATVLAAVVERPTGRLTYSRAGHVPALVVGKDGPVWLESAGGPPLGADPDHERQDVTVQLEDGDLIVLYSDGLVERRGETIDTGLDRLADAVVAARDRSVQEIADHLLRELLTPDTQDDVVLVVKRL